MFFSFPFSQPLDGKLQIAAQFPRQFMEFQLLGFLGRVHVG
ncbi:hypothetical protein BOVA713_3168 [Bacteroides ovatus]|nr:hypothetical protein BOVA713_3168 [Bacteroides ovatus]